MNSTSPPMPVTASPVATPGVAVRSAASKKNFCRPRYSRTSAPSIVTGAVVSADASLVATFRSALPISRSRFRTPASRV